MTLSRANVALSVLLAAVLLAVWAVRVDPQTPNWEFLPDMQYSPASQALGSSGDFSDGRAWQASPADTIARGQMPLHYAATPADAIRAGEELVSPIAKDDAKARAAGAAVYRVNCAMCHGPQGHGDGPSTKRGVPPPPSFVTGKSVQMKDGQLMHVLTYGQGGMAPFGTQLTIGERWQAIAYVRELQAQGAAAAPPATAPAVTEPTDASPAAPSERDKP